ncbi:MAG: hypothetical protein JWQ64_1773 [Subtercola sp.]|jgi:catechol 2,3-dioxygenase-like lactoylglutathione lyase family enzyme|nr:hypothetical protein [Subtercola sp.]
MGLPGMRGTEHIGFTVPDIEQAERFFVDIIGCTLVYSLGPYAYEDDWMVKQLGVHPRTVMHVRFLRCGFGPNFEIFEFETPDTQLPQPKNTDIGGHHLAFYVDDFDEALVYLREKGLTIMGDPVSSKNASEGQRWIYFLSPWGMQLELVSYPKGKAYEKEAPVKLWHPSRPGE